MDDWGCSRGFRITTKGGVVAVVCGAMAQQSSRLNRLLTLLDSILSFVVLVGSGVAQSVLSIG